MAPSGVNCRYYCVACGVPTQQLIIPGAPAVSVAGINTADRTWKCVCGR